MRVFRIQPDNTLAEYSQTPFEVEYEEAVLEDWLESNPDGIVESGGILVIGRQVHTNLGGFIDLLGLDRQGNVVVVELKRDRTPRETIAQALEYASFAERLDVQQLEDILSQYTGDEVLSLAEHHREHFRLGSEEALAFNKDQRIVIIGQRMTPEVRQTAAFLNTKDIRVTCIEFTFFLGDGENRLMSLDTVVDKAPPPVPEAEFLASLDENGRGLFDRLLEYGKQEGRSFNWIDKGKGFRLNVTFDGARVPICYLRSPNSQYGQSFFTSFYHIERKSAAPDGVIQSLRNQVESSRLFVPDGPNYKCQIDRQLTDSEVESLLAWCDSAEKAIQEHGLK